MSELIENLREEFRDSETRHIYADDFLNSSIATQIKVLREQAGWTQAELAEKAGMRQERISVLEDVNYSSWTANVLKRIAKAFDMRLSIKIESFGSFLTEFSDFSRESLARPKFEDDPAFQEGSGRAIGAFAVAVNTVSTSAMLDNAGWSGQTLAPISVETIGPNMFQVTYGLPVPSTTQAHVEEPELDNVRHIAAFRATKAAASTGPRSGATSLLAEAI